MTTLRAHPEAFDSEPKECDPEYMRNKCGHPSREEFLRALRLSRAPQLRAARV